MTSEVTIQCDSNVGKSLQWLRGHGELCDVVIKGYGGQQASGHSCVLAPSSTVVAALLQGRLTAGFDWSIQRPLIITLIDSKEKTSSINDHEDDEADVNVMELLLSLIYGELIHVGEKLLQPLFQYATMLGLSKQIAQALKHLTEESQHNYSGKQIPSGRSGRVKQRRKPVLTKQESEISLSHIEENNVNAINSTSGPNLELRLDTECLPGERTSSVSNSNSHDSSLNRDLMDIIDTENNVSEKGNSISNELLINETGGTDMCDILGTCEDLELPGITNQCSHPNTLSLTDMEVDDRLLPAHDYDTKEDIQRLKKEGLLVSHCSEDLVSETDANEHVHGGEFSREDLKLMHGTIDIVNEGLKIIEGADEIIKETLSQECSGQYQDNMLMQYTSTHHCHDEITNNTNMVENCPNELLELVDQEYPQEEYFMDAQHFKRQQEQQEHHQISIVEAPQQNKSFVKGLICTVCHSTFQDVIDHVKHVLHSLHYTPQCPLCTFQDDDLENQRVHFQNHDDKYPFFCVYCDMRFRKKSLLNMHLPKHMSNKPFVCHQCGRGFKWRHALLAHLQTHNPTRHLLCDICGFSSKTQTTFKAHLLKHTGRDRYPCPYTGCAFKTHRKTRLNDHLATHSKERSHQCEVCGHSFAHAKNLRRHMRLHEPASHFLHCSQHLSSGSRCSFRTTRPDKLRFHLLKKHDVKTSSVSNKNTQNMSSDSLIMLNDKQNFNQPVTITNQPNSLVPSIHMETNEVQMAEQSAKHIIPKGMEYNMCINDMVHITDEQQDSYNPIDNISFKTATGSDECIEEGKVFSLEETPIMINLQNLSDSKIYLDANDKQTPVTSIPEGFPLSISNFIVEECNLEEKEENERVLMLNSQSDHSVMSFHSGLSGHSLSLPSAVALATEQKQSMDTVEFESHHLDLLESGESSQQVTNLQVASQVNNIHTDLIAAHVNSLHTNHMTTHLNNLHGDQGNQHIMSLHNDQVTQQVILHSDQVADLHSNHVTSQLDSLHSDQVVSLLDVCKTVSTSGNLIETCEMSNIPVTTSGNSLIDACKSISIPVSTADSLIDACKGISLSVSTANSILDVCKGVTFDVPHNENILNVCKNNTAHSVISTHENQGQQLLYSNSCNFSGQGGREIGVGDNGNHIGIGNNGNHLGVCDNGNHIGAIDTGNHNTLLMEAVDNQVLPHTANISNICPSSVSTISTVFPSSVGLSTIPTVIPCTSTHSQNILPQDLHKQIDVQSLLSQQICKKTDKNDQSIDSISIFEFLESVNND